MADDYVNRKAHRKQPPSSHRPKRHAHRPKEVTIHASLANTEMKQAPVKGYPFYMKIGILVIAVSLFLFAIVSCTSTEKQKSSEIFSDKLHSTFTAIDFAYTLKDNTPKQDELTEIIGEEDASQILNAAKADRDALWIASHPEKFAIDGPEVQQKILKLAAAEPTSYAYVRNFAESFPVSGKTDDPSAGISVTSPSPDVPETNIPHFYQWDRRWGNTVYCSTAFGLTGCGPTSLAMIYQGLSGNTDLDPYDMGIKAQEYGYMYEYDGTASGFFSEVANDLGINCEMEDATAELIISNLSEGKPIIINFGSGYFTQDGHFAVLAGLDEDGKVILNDPYSVIRSSQTWDAEFLANEAMVMYVYSN